MSVVFRGLWDIQNYSKSIRPFKKKNVATFRIYLQTIWEVSVVVSEDSEHFGQFQNILGGLERWHYLGKSRIFLQDSGNI